MALFEMRIVFMLGFMLAIIAGGIGLQMLLSRYGRWLGLVLPGICFLTSVVSVFYVAEYPAVTIITTFIVYNVPTLVLLAVYGMCRKKQKAAKEMEKMNIQDLQ